MDIIQDMLSESEVLDMPMETLSAFVRLFNVNMNQKVEEYMSMPDANPDVVEKLSMCVGDFVTESTFHLKVKDRDTKSLLMKNNMRDLPMLVYANDVDIDEFISELKWLSQNEDRLHATLPTRTGDMYKEALKAVTIFQKDKSFAHPHDLVHIMTMYRSTLFCPPHAKPQSTGMRSLSLNKNRWKMQLRAAEYLKYCMENGISPDVAREC